MANACQCFDSFGAMPKGTPTRIRGTVDKLDGQALTVKPREGEIVTIALADNVAVAYLVKKNVGDIQTRRLYCVDRH